MNTRTTRNAAIFLAGFFSVSLIADANIYDQLLAPRKGDDRTSLPQAAAALQQETASLAKEPPPLFGPEEMLLDVYEAMRSGSLNDALAKAEALVEKYPKFALGHFMHGDLQLMRSASVTEFGTAAQGNDKLIADLREEAAVRLGAILERPDPSRVPGSILQLAPGQQHAIVVDTSRARLFLYRQVDGRLELVKDFYISQGKNGANKALEGDNKTPIGVYEITKRYTRNQLSEFYGAGALPINYPNAWDTAQARTGYGIWLHGVPPHVYNRPPKSSAGCVVLTNADMDELSNLVDIGATPVVIVDREEFISEREQKRQRELALSLLKQWTAAASAKEGAALHDHYAKDFLASGGTAPVDWIRSVHDGSTTVSPPGISDVQAFDYPGQDDMLAISFTYAAADHSAAIQSRIEQYWKKEQGQWRIVSETRTKKDQDRKSG